MLWGIATNRLFTSSIVTTNLSGKSTELHLGCRWKPRECNCHMQRCEGFLIQRVTWRVFVHRWRCAVCGFRCTTGVGNPLLFFNSKKLFMIAHKLLIGLPSGCLVNIFIHPFSYESSYKQHTFITGYSSGNHFFRIHCAACMGVSSHTQRSV